MRRYRPRGRQRISGQNSTKPAYHFPLRGYLDEKSKKERSWLLTVRSGGDYIRPTNEGGAPLATKKFASKSALCEIQESRVSDTRRAPEPRAKRA
ncbi:MAG: hypothetical protein EOS81_34825, partial [Mesorhizobium sp.]